MRKRLLGFSGAVVFLLLAAVLSACGDKFVVLGRGARLQRAYASAHPASILIYMNPASRVPAAEKEYQLQSALKFVGHRPDVVGDRDGLERALSSRRYDLVLADLSDSPALEKRVETAPGRPGVIPVIYNPTGAELAAAEKRYGCLIKPSKKTHDVLAVIDEAMAARAKGEGAICRAGG